MKRKSIIYVTVGVAVALCGCAYVKGNDKNNDTNNPYADKVDDVVIYGGVTEPTPLYDVFTPDIIKVNKSPITKEEIISVFTNENLPPYLNKRFNKMADTDIVELTRETCREFLDAGGFYVSIIPIETYSCGTSEFVEPYFYVFDKNKKYRGKIHFERYKNGYRVYGFDTQRIFAGDTITSEPEKKFVAIESGSNGVISEENIAYRGGKSTLAEWTVSGDVYGKLKDFSFSYSEIISPENLLWIDLQ